MRSFKTVLIENPKLLADISKGTIFHYNVSFHHQKQTPRPFKREKKIYCNCPPKWKTNASYWREIDENFRSFQ